jgi:hypothetical protein
MICAPCREELHEFCRGDDRCDCECLTYEVIVPIDDIDPDDDAWRDALDRYERQVYGP